MFEVEKIAFIVVVFVCLLVCLCDVVAWSMDIYIYNEQTLRLARQKGAGLCLTSITLLKSNRLTGE